MKKSLSNLMALPVVLFFAGQAYAQVNPYANRATVVANTEAADDSAVTQAMIKLCRQQPDQLAEELTANKARLEYDLQVSLSDAEFSELEQLMQDLDCIGVPVTKAPPGTMTISTQEYSIHE